MILEIIGRFIVMFHRFHPSLGNTVFSLHYMLEHLSRKGPFLFLEENPFPHNNIPLLQNHLPSHDSLYNTIECLNSLRSNLSIININQKLGDVETKVDLLAH